MPTYGELCLDLKDKKKIYPKDNEYAKHVQDWLKINIFHRQQLSENDQ